MEKKFKLGVIGAGFMSSAIINGVISSNYISPSDVIVSDISKQSLIKHRENGVNITTDNKYVCNNAEYVLFAVKPQSFNSVAECIKNSNANNFISIMAGVKISKIKTLLGDVNVARCMPNTPCSVGYGAVGIDCSDYKSQVDREFIKGLFKAFATVVEVPEDKLNVVTGISGSSPAYFYLFIKGIIDAGIKNGLSENDAKMLAVNTMIGSGKMIFNNADKSLDELITAVCSKGGTTIEAINVYNQNELSKITENAISACINRAEQLEKL